MVSIINGKYCNVFIIQSFHPVQTIPMVTITTVTITMVMIATATITMVMIAMVTIATPTHRFSNPSLGRPIATATLATATFAMATFAMATHRFSHPSLQQTIAMATSYNSPLHSTHCYSDPLPMANNHYSNLFLW